MVPVLLAAKISGITEDLRVAEFTIEFSEAEAGRAVKELLRLDMPASDSVNDSELESLRFAAVRLKITSALAVLMEKRSIKKLHDKVPETDPKRKILEYFLYLLSKYGTLIGQHKTEDHSDLHEFKTKTENTEISATPEPPLEFKCPISERVMYNPVVIASGKTFERAWIEKWFQEGNNTCPVTHMRLENFYLTPNHALKGLISKWASNYGQTVSESCAHSIPAPVELQKFSSFRSTARIGSSLNDLHFQVSNISFRSSDTNFDDDSRDEVTNAKVGVGIPQMRRGAYVSYSSIRNSSISCLTSLSKLDLFPWESQCKVVKDFKERLEKFETTSDRTFNNISVKPLIRFLMAASDLSDLKFLIPHFTCRTELPSLDKDAICMLASFLDSAILQVLQSHIMEFHELALKIICNLSYNNDMASHVVYLDCIPKLVPFLGDQNLSGYCLHIVNILCGTEEGRTAIAETSSCIGSIAELLEIGNKQEQESAMEILHSLLHDQSVHCQQAIGDSIIQSLYYISVNENSRRKVMATELLQLLGDKTEADVSDGSGWPSKGFAYFGKKV